MNTLLFFENQAQTTKSTTTRADSDTSSTENFSPTPKKKNFVLKNIYFKQEPANQNLTKSYASLFPAYSEENILLSYYGSFSKNQFQKQNNKSSTSKNYELRPTEPTSQVEKSEIPIQRNRIEESKDNQAKKWEKVQHDKPTTKEEVNEPTNLIDKIKSKQGSRFFQDKVKKDPSYSNKTLYPLLKPYMLSLMCDQFGNYLYQNFLDTLNEENLEDYTQFIFNNFQVLSFSAHGTRIAQKLIESMSIKTEKGKRDSERIIEKIKGNVERYSIDEMGCHIIQKILMKFQKTQINFLFQEIYNSFLKIATTKYGCCVIQKCLLYGNSEQKGTMVNLIVQNTFFLISNQFGNYIYQSLISSCEDFVVYSIFRIISKDALFLCKEKYSSNVIEKIFDIKNKALINHIAKTMLCYDSKTLELICNQYGNYIIQKILDSVTDQELIVKILSVIENNLIKIRKTSYGKKLLTNMSKKYPNLFYGPLICL